jgi:hypothetical protein
VLVPVPTFFVLTKFVQSPGVNFIRAELQVRLDLGSSSQLSTKLQISQTKFSVCLINHQKIECVWKSGGIAPLILNQGTYVEVPSKLA